MRAAALFAVAAPCLFAQEIALPPLADALRQDGPQTVLGKSPAERSRSEILALLRDEPVAFTTRVRQRLQGLAQGQSDRARGLHDEYRELLRRMEERRVDKQGGAGSLVSGASAPRILSLAVESNALAESRSGALTTFRGNLLGVSRWLLGAEQFPYCTPTAPQCGNWSDALRGLAFHVSFDASRPNGGAPGPMRSWGARWEFVNRRDPRDARFRAAWREAVESEEMNSRREAFAASREALLGFAAGEPYRDLLDQLVSGLQSPEARSVARAAEMIERCIEQAAALAQSEPGWQRRVENARTAHAEFIALRDKLASQALARMSYAVEFNAFRPASGAPYSDARIVISGSPVRNEKVLLTGNAGASWWRSTFANSNARTLRDIQAAIQLNRSAGKVSDSIDMIWSLGGSYRRVKTMHATAVEAKLTLSVRGTPLKIPFALAWTGGEPGRGRRDQRASVGIVLDWDAVLSGLGK